MVSSTSSTKTSSAPAQTITVQVGNGDHKFKPDVIQANVGDTIEFTFYPQNHSVIRAEYEHPCIPYEMTGPNKTGFYSGFHAVDAVLSSPLTFSLLINDTAPTFFYCSAPFSCTGQGMVGVINPNATTSIAHQRDLALQAAYQLSPGEPFPSEGETPSTTTVPSPGANPVTKSGRLSGGAIAGIVIACVGVLVLGAAVFWFWGRLKGLSDEVRRKESTVRRVETRESWFPSTGTGTMSSVGAWEGQIPIAREASGRIPG
ncbi:hypothetical protein GRF29_69g2210326 [Pseudopithomyces chartarum]|uniref:Extracellular serine-rich protein n=1 Tax=Pseudopithomyces chartarum TaxID=1892770 RepID=A0AAN6RIR7_9PLEO|nr:hypothetical protein GRF29_69g2210326 [Pseudopithomyces chartarum]